MIHPFSDRIAFRRAGMTGLAGLWLLGLSFGAQALAQDAQPAAPASASQTRQTASGSKAGDGAITTVTVTAQKPPVQNRIDRQVYDNTQNIDSTSGTAADALNKVPSVTVDANGNVALRGNSNVTVLMDGKPSAMLQGDNRAATLQSLSSNDIDSVEVMTNPGAQFSAEGTGGIINLVMKKNRKPGTSGAVIANVGSQGRYNGVLSIARNAGKLTLSGGLNVRHDERDSHGVSVLNRLDSATGAVVSGQNKTSTGTNTIDSLSANGSVDYNLSDIDSVGAQVSYARREFDSTTTSRYDLTGTLPAGSLGDYTRLASNKGPREDKTVDLHWNHTGDQPGETLKTDLRVSSSNGKSTSYNLDTYDAGAETWDTTLASSRNLTSDWSIDYTRNIGQNGIFTAGTDIQYTDNHFLNGGTGPDAIGSAATVNSALTSEFAYRQTISAAYATYQTTLGPKWTVEGGLRVENQDLTTRRVDAGIGSSLNETKFSPSFFAAYNLSDVNKLRFSYSHRLQRPNPQDLNPYITYVDAQNVSQGNPDLKPQETDSYELGLEHTGQFNYQLRGYYRQNNSTITDYSYFLSDGVLLTTKENYGKGNSEGVEFNVQGQITKAIKVSAGGNWSHDTIDTGAVNGKQSGSSLRGRFNVSYQVTPVDTLQLMYFTSGKILTGQGYRGPFTGNNISYRHNFNRKLALVATVNDPFRMGKMKAVTDNGTVYSESINSIQAPTFYIGLTYLLGGASSAPDQGRWGGRRYGGPGGPGPM